MPPLAPVAQTIALKVAGTKLSAPWNNVFHVKYTGSQPTSVQIDALCNSFLAAYIAQFAPTMDTDTTIDSVSGADLTSQTASIGVSSGAGANGSLVGPTLTAQVALVVSWQINLRYRGGHPRTYFPSGTVDVVVGGRTWSASILTLMDTAAGAFITAVNGITTGANSYALSVVSRQSATLLRPTPFVLPVIGHAVHTRVDTQRRRLGREIV
jgi:hypothetical protein